MLIGGLLALAGGLGDVSAGNGGFGEAAGAERFRTMGLDEGTMGVPEEAEVGDDEGSGVAGSGGGEATLGAGCEDSSCGPAPDTMVVELSGRGWSGLARRPHQETPPSSGTKPAATTSHTGERFRADGDLVSPHAACVPCTTDVTGIPTSAKVAETSVGARPCVDGAMGSLPARSRMRSTEVRPCRLANPCNAVASSATLWNRSLGFLARQR